MTWLEQTVNFDGRQAALERWRVLREKGTNNPEAEAELYGFFQSFRPDGRGLDEVFADVVGGPDLLQRLLEVFSATAQGWDPADAYFSVKAPEPFSEADLAKHARRHRDSMQKVAAYVGADELRSLLEAAQKVSVTKSEESTPPAEGANLQVYETTVDFMTSLPAQESDVQLLGEAYYSIACDYFLKYYLLWPLYRHSSPVHEPFEAYFQLWKRGVQCDFGTRGIIGLSTLTAPQRA